MLHGPLHNCGDDGLCKACSEPFPCPTRLTIFETLKSELDQSTQAKVLERCPWCGRESDGGESVDSDGHWHCHSCDGCLAENPYPHGTHAYEAWAVAHGNL